MFIDFLRTACIEHGGRTSLTFAPVIMKRIVATLAAAALLGACTTPPTQPASSEAIAVRGEAFVKGGNVVHRVTGGGADFGGPGFDANWSLVAIQYADGRVKGHLTDAFGHGNGGIHVEINCLEVDGNEAWASGIAKGGVYDGRTWLARVQDNGRSANDPEDLISFSVLTGTASTADCHGRFPLEQFTRRGQVTVD